MTPNGSNKTDRILKDSRLTFGSLTVIRDDNLKTPGAIKEAAGHKRLLTNLQKVGSEKNIESILKLEILHLEEELERFAKNKEHITSLKNGIKQMNTVLDRLDFVRDHQGYQIFDQRDVVYAKNRTKGVPNDVARKDLNSHITRLGNPLRDDLDENKKELLVQRRKNVKIAEEIYIELQIEAIGRDIVNKRCKDTGLSQ